MKRLACVAALALAACATHAQARGAAMLARGHHLVAQYCASCHAVGRTGESPRPESPPFRFLSRNYRVDSLEEALAEGISVGHPAMPEFQFSPDDVDAIIAYLQSIQQYPTPPQR